MRRGEVRWYTFASPDRRRPVVILTRDSAIGYLSSLTVVPVTTTIRRIPSEVPLNQTDGLREQSVANCDNIQTVPKSRIGPLIASLSPTKLEQLRSAVSFALGMEQVD